MNKKHKTELERIGKSFTSRAKEKKLTNYRLKKLTGLNTNQVKDILSGQSNYTITSLFKMMEALGVQDPFNEKHLCFKKDGEKIIKELGFKFDHEYDHDCFHTNRYRKGLLIVEFTYEGFDLKTVDLTIDEIFCKPITYVELKAMASILGVIPEQQILKKKP